MDFLKYIKYPWKIALVLNCHGLGIIIPDRLFLKSAFRERMGYRLDLKNPRTFNEKLQWLKLYNRKQIYITMVDKYDVKKYAASIIGDKYIIPTLGVWDKFEDIDFARLPDKFVLKCTHDSGGIIMVDDKNSFDKATAAEKLNKCLKIDYYLLAREWPYKKVKPRIIAEKYLTKETAGNGTHCLNQGGQTSGLTTGVHKDYKAQIEDYKFFCFNGKVKCFKVDFDRATNHGANYYDINKKILPFGEKICPPDFGRNINMPPNIDEMMVLAEKMSTGYPFLRVDMYNINGDIYLGELTLFPAAGFGAFIPEEWDYILGNEINLAEII